ncbi:MAG: DUF4124 domain-containing protein [Betaproteobacteria bacterium]|nr:MAG: DUF4124 domain-containing protein [Betaproteobacteria bacterium]
MITLLASLLLAAPPAQAQMYKCVDARGKTQYSDKPIPGCKSTTTVEPPPPPPKRAAPGAAGKPPAKQAAKPAPKGEMGEYTAEQRASRCKTLREERDWLQGPAGRRVQSHDERLAQVEQALRECR